MSADGARVHIALRVKDLPIAISILVLRLQVKIVEVLHVYHPEVVERALSDVVTTVDVESKFDLKGDEQL